MTLYAAYGSNLDTHRMAELAPASPVYGSGWLHGWRLTFAGQDLALDGALATVVEDDDSAVFVMLYDMTAHDEAALDAWEGLALGHWRKLRVRVAVNGSHELAWLYVIDDYEGGMPSQHYLDAIVIAAQMAGAPAPYLDGLRAHPTID
jgi:gamma-glutamylcyclotransferase (GGCT)/AIG2-like uncharacterized protein YtfP